MVLSLKECTLLLHFGTRAYLFSPEEGLCYVFSTRNNYYEFLAFCGCYYRKCYSIIFENAKLWCFIVTLNSVKNDVDQLIWNLFYRTFLFHTMHTYIYIYTHSFFSFLSYYAVCHLKSKLSTHTFLM